MNVLADKRFFCWAIVLFLYISVHASIRRDAVFSPTAEMSKELTSLMPGVSFPRCLGKGLHGSVWGSDTHDVAVKLFLSHKGLNASVGKRCRREFTNMLRAYEALAAYDLDGSLRQRATFIKPHNFYVSNDGNDAFITMQRVPTNYQNNFLKMRLGNPLNYNKVMQLFNTLPAKAGLSVKNICYDLGHLLSLLHFGAHIDGYDVESYLELGYGEKPFYRITMLDFGETQCLDRFFDQGKKEDIFRIFATKLTRHFKYYPLPINSSFKYFRDGYLAFARTLDKQNSKEFCYPLAISIIKNYILHYLLHSEALDIISQNKILLKSFSATFFSAYLEIFERAIARSYLPSLFIILQDPQGYTDKKSLQTILSKTLDEIYEDPCNNKEASLKKDFDHKDLLAYLPKAIAIFSYLFSNDLLSQRARKIEASFN